MIDLFYADGPNLYATAATDPDLIVARIPEAERRRPPGQRTDLRKLSAWIKMMRALEEARQRGDKDED